MADGKSIFFYRAGYSSGKSLKRGIGRVASKERASFEALFNTSGILYKEKKLKDRLPELSEEEQLELLATDGMLVKRPILVTEDKVLVGFREKEWETI